jgi:hypothetical protein
MTVKRIIGRAPTAVRVTTFPASGLSAPVTSV